MLRTGLVCWAQVPPSLVQSEVSVSSCARMRSMCLHFMAGQQIGGQVLCKAGTADKEKQGSSQGDS